MTLKRSVRACLLGLGLACEYTPNGIEIWRSDENYILNNSAGEVKLKLPDKKLIYPSSLEKDIAHVKLVRKVEHPIFGHDIEILPILLPWVLLPSVFECNETCFRIFDIYDIYISILSHNHSIKKMKEIKFPDDDIAVIFDLLKKRIATLYSKENLISLLNDKITQMHYPFAGEGNVFPSNRVEENECELHPQVLSLMREFGYSEPVILISCNDKITACYPKEGVSNAIGLHPRLCENLGLELNGDSIEFYVLRYSKEIGEEIENLIGNIVDISMSKYNKGRSAFFMIVHDGYLNPQIIDAAKNNERLVIPYTSLDLQIEKLNNS